jgi:hypothetical protein
MRTLQIQLTHVQRELQRASEKVASSGSASVDEELLFVRKRLFLVRLPYMHLSQSICSHSF